MDLTTTAEEEEFRARVRSWLRENVPREPQPLDGPEARAFDTAWQRKQYDAGFAGISWPKEFGGQGLSLIEQMIWFEELALAGAPDIGVCFVGINHAGPTLIARGSAAQKAFHLPRILSGEAVWCQGFSEPGSGSDLASLSTKAVIDGDHLVVSGQKIWTSYADQADYQELLVRTSTGEKPHHGITWVICDMHAPGVTVRPILNMAGAVEFCEVFYDEVRIPLANVVGEVGQGWSVAMSTLSFERGTGFMKDQVELSQHIDHLVSQATAGKTAVPLDDALAARLATARAEATALRAMALADISRNARRPQPGAESSMVRLFHAELSQRVERLALDLGGDDALLTGGRSIAYHYLYSFAATIAAGTKDVQRNLIGERLLGLPRGR